MPSKTSPTKKSFAHKDSEGDVFLPQNSIHGNHRGDNKGSDFIVITPPPSDPQLDLNLTPETTNHLPEILEVEGQNFNNEALLNLDGVVDKNNRKEKSRDDSAIRGLRTTLDSNGDVLRSGLSTSRSWSNLALRDVELCKTDATYLRPPKNLLTKRSLSSEFQIKRNHTPEKVKKTKSMPRSPTKSIQQFESISPGRTRKSLSLSRVRSPSPVFPSFMRSRSGKSTSPDETSKGSWPRGLRFLARKASSAPVTSTIAAHREFEWQFRDNTGSVSDSLEGSDMILNSNTTTDGWQADPSNGVEPVITATHISPLGNTAGPGPSGFGNGSTSDVPDGFTQSSSRHSAIEHLQQKILKISEQIKIEQTSRDENVAEYLKLAKDADKQQAARIKSVFEKKNQKSKANVAQLQKKLENYHRRLKEIESNGPAKTQPKYGLKEVGAKFSDFSGGVVGSVKGSLSGLSQVTQNAAGAIVSKPKDFASKIKNRFGSADNIPTLKDDEDGSEGLDRYNSADDISMSTSGSADLAADTPTHTVQLSHQQLLHQISTLRAQMANMHQQLLKVQDLEEQQERLKNDIDQIKSQVQRDIGLLTSSLQDERFRCARLEDQLHDLSEMHHRELSDIKQEISSMEEKIEYHAQERARDIQEALESCQTRIAKMEVQQHHQHQQLVTMEGVENATARALLGKLINLLLSVLAVILVFVSTVSGIVMPFFKSQTRMVFTALCILFLAVLYRNWDPWTTYISGFWSDR